MTLRPSLRTRLVYFVLSVLLLALAVGATFFAPVIGIAAILFAGFATVNGAFRLFHPRSYATRLEADGFEVFGALGNSVHRVRWSQVAHLTVFNGNGLGGAGTVLHLAWRCDPRCPGHGRQPWVRGGRNNVGEEFDGALPAPYLGIEQMLALFSRHIGDVAPADAGLAAALDALEGELRGLSGWDGLADWVALRRARLPSDPDGVRADVRGALGGGMGSIADAPVDRELVGRVEQAIGPARS